MAPPNERLQRSRGARRLAAMSVVGVFALAACTPGPASKDTNGGGPIGYATSSLVPIPLRRSTFAALISGLRNIEIVNLSSLPPSILTARNPADGPCVAFPVSMAAGDVNADGMDDILVMDPSCGSWVGLGQSNGDVDGVAWGEVLPDIGPRHFLSVVKVEERRPIVLSATEHVLAASHRQDTGPWKSWSHTLGQRTSQWLAFTHIFAVRKNPTPGVEILFQTAGFLTPLQLRLTDDDVLVEPGADFAEEPSGGAIRAHAGFDHLVGFAADGCDIIAIGIGFYPSSAGNLPRRVSVLRRMGDRFVADELPFDCDAITFGITVQSSDVFVGALTRCGDGVTANLMRLRECGRRAEVVARQRVEFDWRRPRAPPGSSPPTLRATDGIDMYVETLESNAVRLATYDGFTIRTIVMQDEITKWSVREERFEMHATREDVAW